MFAWLQLRFERAFGILPVIFSAGLAMGAYHIGTFPLSGVLTMALFGLQFALRVSRDPQPPEHVAADLGYLLQYWVIARWPPV